MFRRRCPDRAPEGVELDRLPPKWRAPVEEALATRARFRDVVDRAPEGPLRQRLARLMESIDEAVLGCYRTAARAHAAESALASVDPQRSRPR